MYRAVQTPVDLGGLAGQVAAIHSPRAGARLAELVAERATVALAAISRSAAAAAGTGWLDAAIADSPSDGALLATAAGLCNNTDRA